MSFGRVAVVISIVVSAGVGYFSVLQMRDRDVAERERVAIVAELDAANALVGRSERDVDDLERRLGLAAQELAELRDEAALLHPTADDEGAGRVELCIIDQNTLINELLVTPGVRIGQDRLDDLTMSCNLALEYTAQVRAGR